MRKSEKYEIEIAKEHNGRHIGGPGNPDFY